MLMLSRVHQLDRIASPGTNGCGPGRASSHTTLSSQRLAAAPRPLLGRLLEETMSDVVPRPWARNGSCATAPYAGGGHAMASSAVGAAPPFAPLLCRARTRLIQSPPWTSMGVPQCPAIKPVKTGDWHWPRCLGCQAACETCVEPVLGAWKVVQRVLGLS